MQLNNRSKHPANKSKRAEADQKAEEEFFEQAQVIIKGIMLKRLKEIIDNIVEDQTKGEKNMSEEAHLVLAKAVECFIIHIFQQAGRAA